MDNPTPDTPIQPSEQQMFATLRKLGVADDEAYAFVRGTESMAGQNVIAEIRVQNAKLDAQNAMLDGAIKAQNAMLDSAIKAQNARLDSAIKVQNARLDAQNAMLDAQQREINSLRWMIGLGFTGLAILITALSLLA